MSPAPIRPLADVDLTGDPAAQPYVKSEVVQVVFAIQPGEIQSREGANKYAAGDALVTGSTGDRWSVSRERFEKKYLAVTPETSGRDGAYRARPVIVLARQMMNAFCVERSAGGDMLKGDAGDWLLQYSPGDHGVVENARFRQVYRLAAK